MQDLKELVKENVDRDWTEIWQEFHRDAWFRERLERSATTVLRQTGLPRGWKDDVKQEALIVFARALKRNTTLGFDTSRGSIKSFISTVIFRCCQKGIRQFRNSMHQTIRAEAMHPIYETATELENQIDLTDSLARISEPYRTTARRLLTGQSVEEIAQSTRLSTRTIYRYLERATELLRVQMAADQGITES